MKRKIMILFLLFAGSLSFVETTAMGRWQRFKNYFTRRTKKGSFKHKTPFKQKTKRFYSQTIGKQALKSSRIKRVGIGTGIFGTGGFFAWLKSWWSGEQAEKSEIQKSLSHDSIVSYDESHEHMNENPNYRFLSHLGIRSFSDAALEIARKVDEPLSLEDKTRIAWYLANESRFIDTENSLKGYTHTPSLTILPLLVYLRQNKPLLNDVPESLIPERLRKEQGFSPVLFTGSSLDSPIVKALHKSAKPIDFENFSQYVSTPIVNFTGIKNKEAFTSDLWELCNNQKYQHYLQDLDLLSIKDSYQSKQKPDFNTAYRYFSGFNRQADILTFDSKELNEAWSGVYFQRDMEQFEHRIERHVPTLKFSKRFQLMEERKIQVDSLVNIKEGTIYENKELLQDVDNLINKYK